MLTKPGARCRLKGLAQLLGVLTNRDLSSFSLPSHASDHHGGGAAWIRWPVRDDFQKVQVKAIRATGRHRIAEGARLSGNPVLFFGIGS